jgi:hypothetical protein
VKGIGEDVAQMPFVRLKFLFPSARRSRRECPTHPSGTHGEIPIPPIFGRYRSAPVFATSFAKATAVKKATPGRSAVPFVRRMAAAADLANDPATPQAQREWARRGRRRPTIQNGRDGRLRFTRDQRHELLAAFERSGQSAIAFARICGVSMCCHRPPPDSSPGGQMCHLWHICRKP